LGTNESKVLDVPFNNELHYLNSRFLFKQKIPMRAIFIFLFFLISITLSKGQSYQSMTENQDLESGTLIASYNAQFVKNRKTQDVYELDMSIKNSGFDLLKFKNDIGRVEYDLSEYWLANIKFKNATGSNLTVKEGHVDAREFKQNITFECNDCNSEDGEKVERSRNMLIGYGLKQGQSVKRTYRIRVPKGEKPIVEIQFVNYN